MTPIGPGVLVYVLWISRRWPFIPHCPPARVTGRWGLPWLVPRPVDVSVAWGRPVRVGPRDPAPSEARVAAVFEAYCAELRRLFDEHKDQCLPPEVAARGLTITHRGRPGEASAAAEPRSRL